MSVEIQRTEIVLNNRGARGVNGTVVVTSATGQAVASRMALAAISSPVAGQVAYLSESGREGTFVFDSSNLTTSVSGDTTQGIYVAPASATSGASGAWVRRYNGAKNAKWFGAVGDGSTNDYTALQAWLDSGGDLYLPALSFYSASSLILRKHVNWEGVGFTEESLAIGGYPNQPGSHINFGAGAGFTIQSSFVQTDVATVLGNVNLYRVQEGASNSTIRNVAFVGANTGATVTGLYIRTKISLENVWVVQFTGKGFDLSGSADAPDGNSEYGSVDLSTLINCQSKLNGSHGYHLRGRDVNVCRLIGCSAQQNTGWGILDESAFGNSYIEPHLATNVAGAIKAIAGASSSLFANPYVEGGTGEACQIGGANVIVGRDLTLNNTPPGLHPAMISGKRVSSANFEITDTQIPAAVTAKGVIFNDVGGNGTAIQGIGSGADVSFWNKNAALCGYLFTGTTNWQFVGDVSSGGAVNSITGYKVGGTQVVAARQAPIANDGSGAANAATVNAILAMLRVHGLIG